MTELDLFENNSKLVYKILNELNISKTRNDYEDILQEGFIGLWNACKKYDKSKNFQFSTFAYPCIKNQIMMYFRNLQKDSSINSISLDATLKDDDNTTFLETIASDDNIIEKTNSNDLMYIFNNLKFKNKELFEEWLNGSSIKELSDKYKTSHQNIQKKIRTAKDRVSNLMFQYLYDENE